MKKLLSLAVLLILATGCSKAEDTNYTIYESDTVIVERSGMQTVVSDITSGSQYVFKTTKSHEKKESVSNYASSTPVCNTDGIELQTVFNLIILTDKANEQTIYIR